MLTTDVKEKGGLAAVRAYLDAGASTAQVKAFIDSLDAPEVEEAIDDDDATNAPVEIASERRRLGVKILRDVPESTLTAGRRAGMGSQGYPGYLVAESFPTPGDYPTEILSEPAVVEDIRMEDAIPGDHPLSVEERLVNLWPKTPQGGLSPAAERMLAQSQGSPQLTIGDLPIPGGETLSLEDVRNAAIMGRIARPVRFSGEYAGGMPVPE
jgi:hypothetical protein